MKSSFQRWLSPGASGSPPGAPSGVPSEHGQGGYGMPGYPPHPPENAPLDLPTLSVPSSGAFLTPSDLPPVPVLHGDGATRKLPESASIAARLAEAGLEGRGDRVTNSLLASGVVTIEDVLRAEERNDAEGEAATTLWRALAATPSVDAEAVYAEAARRYAFRQLDLTGRSPDPAFAERVHTTFDESQRDQLARLGVLPLEYAVDPNRGQMWLVFAARDPSRSDIQRFLHGLHLGHFELGYAPADELEPLLTALFPQRNEYLERLEEGESQDALDLGLSFDDEKSDLVDEEALDAAINRSTLINLFEASLVEAVRQGASDLHIFPNRLRQTEFHLRVDGALKLWHTEDKVHPEAMLAVVKDRSRNVDRFDREAAQDGYIQRDIDDTIIRFRVSILPIATAMQEVKAESIVIRVLDDRKVFTDLKQVGLLPDAMERFVRAISQPHGMVILTGPTGSGKSTTLVAALGQVVKPTLNVLTVEDPVEYLIRGVRQIKLSSRLSLSQALRAILRHDPDVVMVGEMRDQETAQLAVKLANTGHLTFSTLHTNDAPSAVSRLYKMGIEPFLIAYAINLVVAQRLIRTLCPICRREDPKPDPILLERIGFSADEIAESQFFRASSGACTTCSGTGYKGRRAISEALYFSRAIRHLIVEAKGDVDEDAIRQLAIEEGMLTLTASAREVVKLGETSIDEVMRVTSTG